MRVPGLKFVRSAVRWSSLGLQRHALVLGYHRIAAEASDPHNLCVTPQHLVEQLEVLKSVASPITLEQLVSSLGREAPPRRGVVITFDDGYLDNLTTALPVLRRFEVPATVFVATGWMGREFWWDTLTRMIQSQDRLGRPLEVSIDDKRLRWHPRESGLEQAKRDLIRAAGDFMRKLSPTDQTKALGVVRDWCDFQDGDDPQVRGMTWEEVSRLASDDLIEIGSHTISHPMLRESTIEEQRYEITASKMELEKALGRPVKSFCYPNGSFSKDTPRIVQEARYDCACTTVSGPAVRRSNPYLLPRLWVPDIPGERFRRWLKRRLW